MTQRFSQDPLKTKELYDYLNFFLTKELEDEKHVKRIKMLAKRTVTLSDVVVVVSALTEHQTEAIAQLIDRLQVQERVLKKLEATEEMFVEANEEYETLIKEREEALKAQFESAKKALEKAEESIEYGESLTEEKFDNFVDKLQNGEK